MPLTRRVTAEFIGTLWLVLGGCGSAVLAAAFPSLGIGFVGVSMAFGLTVVTMAYAVGHISGCHLNPAVTLGLWSGKRFPAKDILPYIVAQVLGAIAGAGILYVIASGKTGRVWTRLDPEESAGALGEERSRIVADGTYDNMRQNVTQCTEERRKRGTDRPPDP